jgi:hypothetical protein
MVVFYDLSREKSRDKLNHAQAWNVSIISKANLACQVPTFQFQHQLQGIQGFRRGGI